MISRNEIAKEVDTVWELTDNEMYERLGISAMGSENLTALSDTLGLMRGIAENTDGAAANSLLTNTLLEKGRIFFEGL